MMTTYSGYIKLFIYNSEKIKESSIYAANDIILSLRLLVCLSAADNSLSCRFVYSCLMNSFV